MVGGMKLCELSSFSPNLLSKPTTLYTQCACERTCHGGNLGCLEWVCTDDIAKNGGFWKRKKAGGVGWSAGAQEGVPEHQKEVGWVAQKLIGEGVEWYQI